MLTVIQPIYIIVFYKTGKHVIRFRLLHLQYIIHVAVRLFKFQFPIDKFLIEIFPPFSSQILVNPHAYFRKILLVIGTGELCYYLFLVKIFLYRQKNLFRVDRFYKVIGNLSPDCHIHYIFLFTFRYHYDRYFRPDILYLRQSFKAAHSGHILIQEDKIEHLITAKFHCIKSISHSRDFITFSLKKHHMRT